MAVYSLKLDLCILILFAIITELKCNINFTDETGTDCESYKINEYCTKTGEEGMGWKRNIFGSLEKYLNKNNESALVCPQCGCKPGNSKK